jgi:site-specific recombinase XerC
VPVRTPRAIPDQQWDTLFTSMGCTRDRALLSCYVSSGARASELLGVELSDVDWQHGRLWVISKGTRLRQPVPVSPEALAYLAAYFDEAGLPEPGRHVPSRAIRSTAPPQHVGTAARPVQPVE